MMCIVFFFPSKAVITTCLNIVLSDDSNVAVDSGSDHSVAYRMDGGGCGMKIFVPAKFCSAVIKVTALQMHSLGVCVYLTTMCFIVTLQCQLNSLHDFAATLLIRVVSFIV
jgi:hypothetical protein